MKGGPGKGKTMLMIGLINELSTRLQSGSEPGNLSYFFCQGTDQRFNNVAGLSMDSSIGSEAPPSTELMKYDVNLNH
jgi:hypothetical protein